MSLLKVVVSLVLALFLLVPASGQSANSAYKNGVRAEKKGDLDSAFEAYKMAHDKVPTDSKYLTAYLRTRLSASTKHIEAGQGLRDVYKLQEALAEFQRAAEIDRSNFAALQEVSRTAELIRAREEQQAQPPVVKAQATSLIRAAGLAAGPAKLTFKSEVPLTLHMVAMTDVVYRTLGKLAGFNVLVDPEYKPQKINFELTDVSLQDALAMLALQSRTFWRPVSANTIMVSADNSGKRRELEQNVMQTFYLQNAATPAELQQAAATLKSILDISRIQITPEQRALTIRGTPDQIILAQKLLQDVDKPKAEVMIEIAVLEVSRTRSRSLGINPPTTVSASLQPSADSAGSSTAGFTLNSLAGITASNVAISIPGATLSALMSDGNTKVLQKPQLRAMDSEKASLKIGDRIPVSTGSFQSGIGLGVNTQFTYIDVGVNVDVTPYIHANREVTLKMSFEVSSVTGEQTISGVTEPTIGQRRIEHEARLKDGEVNLIGGILQDSDSHSLSGYPWLARIPILKYLFAQESKDREQNEIVFAITPHIIRANEVDLDNQKMIDVGTGTSTGYRAISDDSAAPIVPAPIRSSTVLQPAAAGAPVLRAQPQQ